MDEASQMPDLEPLPEDWDCALAIAAHPDDFEYGMASAVARWTSQGKQVTYVLVTRGEAGLDIPPEDAGPLREDEERRSAAVVGVEDVSFLDYRDGVIEYGLPLRRDIVARCAPCSTRHRAHAQPSRHVGRTVVQHGRSPQRRPGGVGRRA